MQCCHRPILWTHNSISGAFCCHRPTLWTHNSTRRRVSTLSGKTPLASKCLIINTLLKILGANRAEDYLQNVVNQAFSDQGQIVKFPSKRSDPTLFIAASTEKRHPVRSMCQRGKLLGKYCLFPCRVDRKTASCAFYVSMRQKRNGTKKAPAGARRRACLCPRHRDDEQRHTSPGAAGVFEGAAPPVLIVRAMGQLSNQF